MPKHYFSNLNGISESNGFSIPLFPKLREISVEAILFWAKLDLGGYYEVCLQEISFVFGLNLKDLIQKLLNGKIICLVIERFFSLTRDLSQPMV